MFTKGIELGRLFGIRIRLDWSLIIIFLLVAFNLGAGVFPAWHPEWSVLLAWGVALAAATLFFVSILIHELSHALVAKMYGIPVDSITLFLFGGIANIEHDPETPKHEALMAGIGPVVSIGLGIAFTALGAFIAQVPADAAKDPMRAFQQMGPVATLLTWLGPINILVGLFNMIPGFPLDGGRVMRAALWGITKDLDKATRWSSRIGQGFAWLLIGTGVAMAFGAHVPIFGTGLIGGLWLAFIGWFLNGAAVMSYRQLTIRRMLEGQPVSRIMRRQLPPAVDARTPVSTLVDEYMMQSDEDVFLVVEGDTLVGLVGPAQVRRLGRGAWQQTSAGDVATPREQLHEVDADADAFQAMKTIGRGKAETILVYSAGQLVGMVRPQDIARWLELHARDDRRGPTGVWRPSSN